MCWLMILNLANWRSTISQLATIITSDNSGKVLLKSAFDAGTVDLYEVLMSPPETDLDDDIPLSDYANEDLAALFPPTESQDQDTDKGPFEAWRVAFNPCPCHAWVMLTNNSGLRERAYVFWDFDRIETYNMLKLFENAPEESKLQDAYDDFGEMHESFEERSKIWHKGGSGFWSKYDESRIVWPTGSERPEPLASNTVPT
ncbi:hypothetical protein M426DRAFT_268527 [Hypoxylon sp. CI-4A]|nr:hypothetical protein M426DRAFT_268527 [Hypoxylon sp. CI-4A]